MESAYIWFVDGRCLFCRANYCTTVCVSYTVSRHSFVRWYRCVPSCVWLGAYVTPVRGDPTPSPGILVPASKCSRAAHASALSHQSVCNHFGYNNARDVKTTPTAKKKKAKSDLWGLFVPVPYRSNARLPKLVTTVLLLKC